MIGSIYEGIARYKTKEEYDRIIETPCKLKTKTFSSIAFLNNKIGVGHYFQQLLCKYI